MSATSEETACDKFIKILRDPKTQCGEKYRSIFELKSIGTAESVNALINNFDQLDDSDLLKHEVTYALGQMDLKFSHIIKPFLIKVLEDEKEYPVVRHESGEGLSNFAEPNDKELLPIFEKYALSSVKEVSGTCSIAAEKVKTFNTLAERYG